MENKKFYLLILAKHCPSSVIIILCIMQTRILVTHGIGFLPQCDVIVVMSNGVISEVGTYSELIDANEAFAQFLQTYQSTIHQAEEKDDGKCMYTYL